MSQHAWVPRNNVQLPGFQGISESTVLATIATFCGVAAPECSNSACVLGSHGDNAILGRTPSNK
eukprot:6776809-Alexandrium_andersonii.AAC.1